MKIPIWHHNQSVLCFEFRNVAEKPIEELLPTGLIRLLLHQLGTVLTHFVFHCFF